MTSEEAGITKEDINSFRVGDFHNAADNLKAKWYTVMLIFLPTFCGKFTKKVRASELASKFTSISDEAIVLWHIFLYGPTWEKVAKEQNKKKQKKEGQHYSRTEMNLFYDLHTRIEESRSNLITGEGWDKAVRDEAIRQMNRGKSKYQTEGKEQMENSQGTLEPIIRYDVKFSPGKSIRLQKRTVTLLYED